MVSSNIIDLRRITLVSGCLLWSLIIASSAANADSRVPDKSVVYLAIVQRPPLPGQTGLLSLEIFRQAFLIAARDGLGLQTRDECLREWGTTPPTGCTLAPSLNGRELDFRGAVGSPDEIVWQGKIAGDDWPNNDAGLAVAAEKLSREEFVQALQTHGWLGQAHAFKSGAGAPPEAESLLSQMDEFSQFTAVRLTHAAMRSDGESLPRLGVLVRAYSNLGQLTRFHWSLESKVYAARSLLYAQRMVAHDPGSAFALWHRAYARALAGLHRSALDDLFAAAQLHQPNPPDWAALLDAYCRYHTGRLVDLAVKDPAHDSFAMYLAFLTVENGDSQGATMNIAQAALELNPNCPQLIDAMCNYTGPGMLNALNEMGPRIFSQILGDRLQKMPDMPQSITDLIDTLRLTQGSLAVRQVICQALIDDGTPQRDSGEPSLAALGRLMQETTFAQSRRYADFVSQALGVDAGDYVKKVWPLMADHPWKNTIQAYGLWQGGDWKAIGRVLDDQSFDQVTIGEFFTIYDLEGDRGAGGRAHAVRAYDKLYRNLDCTSFDIEPLVNWYGNETLPLAPWLSQYLDFVSPNSPVLIAAQIRDHWDTEKAKAWVSDHADNPTISFALAQHYLALDQWKEAEQCLKNYISVSPDERGFEALAEVYRDQNNEGGWIATLKEFLDQPDYGLQHAAIQVEIANYYMARGAYSKGLPYADAAAETGAAWARSCAAEAHTGVGDYKTAEELLVDNMNHYNESPFEWFAWCVRTGHGDRNGAMTAMQNYLTAPGKQHSNVDRMQLATLRMLQQNEHEAIKTFPDAADGHLGVLSYLHIAILDDVVGDAGGRDLAVRQAINTSREGSSLNQFAMVLSKTFEEEPNAMPEARAIDRLLKSAKANDRCTIAYLTARCLDKRGKPDQATKYLRRGIAGNSDNNLDLLLIADALQKRGIDAAILERPTTRPAP